MTILLLITSGLILLCLLYPAFLMACPPSRPSGPEKNDAKQAVSLILVTYNGAAYLREKIASLQRELQSFEESELIVIDDCSTDGTRELLESLKILYSFRLILKDEHRGIPHSMNMGVRLARYEYLIFCDQRQHLSQNILREMIVPLRREDVGAVSGYISGFDRDHRRSFLREAENFIKKRESRAGCLIGVYGPLYAIRKDCYEEIGETVILDDLYLSLKILGKKKIVLMEKCRITDEDFLALYDYQRSRRYVKGLFQLLVCKDLVKPLPFRIKFMLIWHKYLRLLIPPLLMACYLATAVLAFSDTPAALLFATLTGLFLISLWGGRITVFRNLNAFFRMGIYYGVSILTMGIPREAPKFSSAGRTRSDRLTGYNFSDDE